MTWPIQSEGLSIVIPTFNERDNIEQVLTGLGSIRPLLNRPLEVILVDDQSPDGTADHAERIARLLDLEFRVLVRSGRRSMGGAIAAGLQVCRWDLVCVMDADLSHPAETVPSLVKAFDGADGVIASRYVPGAKIEAWPFRRRLTSYVATWIPRLSLSVRCHDPLSGFFLFRRSFLKKVEITGKGNKPLLEILVGLRPVVHEVPYAFRNRANGQSKLNTLAVVQFLSPVFSLHSASRRGATPANNESDSWDADTDQP